jgi:hypothetical protein
VFHIILTPLKNLGRSNLEVEEGVEGEERERRGKERKERREEGERRELPFAVDRTQANLSRAKARKDSPTPIKDTEARVPRGAERSLQIRINNITDLKTLNTI